MILSNKIRKMSDPEKMQYFLEKVVDMDPNTRQARELLMEITALAKDTPVNQFLEKFQLEGSFDENTTPPCVKIKLPNREELFVIDINDPTRKDFKDPQPVEKPVAASFLTPEELKELEDYHE